MDEHFEAEQVLFALRSQGERVAKATIYRTLPLLVECGILKQVRFDVKQSHYRVCFGDAPRDNMVCRNCGRIIEFSSEDLTRLRDRLARKHQFQPLSHRLQISGFCQECAKGKR
jgi:Fur family ferric uptake transcriptional regulator